MFEVIFAALPIAVTFGTLLMVSLTQCRSLPQMNPEVVIVRVPYGFPTKKIKKEMKLHQNECNIHQGPLYHLKYPIVDLTSTEKAMVEIANRLSVWKRHFATPWFLLHIPEIDHVSLLETMLTTHGYTVNVMDYPVPLQDGFPTPEYYEWAENCPFVKEDESLIQAYHSSWQSWPNMGRNVLETDNSDKEE